ncbi:MAG: hypothetical protein EPN58_11380 [Rhodanobacter sp.]|nr:MAG: hypothetical protein EPN58_11380 [Rhodanobacter sp.]
MNNNTAAQIVRNILVNAPKEFYEQEAQARGEAGSWAEAKALAIFATLTPAERAQALAPAPVTPWGRDHDFTAAEWDQIKIATGVSQNADDYHWAYRSEVPEDRL